MPIYVFALRAMGPRIRNSSQEVQQRLEVLSGELHEKVAGVAIVKGFARESAETKRFASHADKLLQRVLHSVRFTAANEVAVGFVVHTDAGSGRVVRRASDPGRHAHGRRAHAVPALPRNVLLPAAAPVGPERRAQ